MIRSKTGLPVDAYFSGTKIKWILNHTGATEHSSLRFGTIDTWLIWKLTGGAVHASDYTNASRTMLFDLKEKSWSQELCDLIGVPMSLLPEVRPSMGDFGTATSIPAISGIPILGVAGDQQAALFGQCCFAPGQVKNTYGTGCFMMMNTGDTCIESKKGLLTTLAVRVDGSPCYALEGSVFIAGAAIQWVRDELGLISHASESLDCARAVDDNAGVYLVPAFAGLGAPYWDMAARGTLVGLTRGANRNHIVRAALESMAYQTADVLSVMTEECGHAIDALAVDGGATANPFLLQFQADILNIPIHRPTNVESTSIGAAMLAGLQAGLWPDTQTVLDARTIDATFHPEMNTTERETLLDGWAHAIRQTRCT